MPPEDGDSKFCSDTGNFYQTTWCHIPNESQMQMLLCVLHIQKGNIMDDKGYVCLYFHVTTSISKIYLDLNYIWYWIHTAKVVRGTYIGLPVNHLPYFRLK
jgi:hypothetical protein